MTSPNVGKITLQAAIEHDALRSQLTREIQKEVLPKLKPLYDEVQKVNEEIAAVNNKPLKEIADTYKLVSTEADEVRKATNQATTAQNSYNDAVNRAARLLKERNKLRRQAAAQEKRDGKVALDTQEKLNRAEQAWESARNRRNALKEAWEIKLANIEKVRQKARKQYHAEIIKMRDMEIEGLQELIRNSEGAADRIIADLTRRTNAEINEGRRAMKERDRQRAADEAAEERAAAKREKRAEREERLRRALVKRRLASPAAVVGEIGRALSGFAPRLSSSAFSIIAEGALTIVGAAGSAAQALWLIPAAAGAAGAGIGALSLAFMGFGDTIGALIDGDLDKFDEMIQKLAPSAQQTALEIQALGSVFRDLQQSAQEAFFNGGPQMVRALTESYAPIIDDLMTRIATASNAAVRELFDTVMQGDVREQIFRITDNIAKFFERLTPVVEPLTRALLDIMEVGAEFLPGLADGAGNLATRFAEFIHEAKESGKLHEWLQRGLDTVGKLVTGAWEIGRAIAGLAPVAEKILPYIVKALTIMADLLTEHPALIFAVAGAFGAWAVLKGVVGLIANLGLISLALGKNIPTMIRSLGALITGTFARAGGTMRNAFPTTFNSTALVGGLSAVDNKIDRTSGKLAGLTRSLGTVGKFTGGTAAGIGATLLIEDIISKNMQSTAALDGYKSAAQQAKDAQNELNTALMNSGGAWDVAAQGAAKSAVQAGMAELESLGKSRASGLDRFRDKNGSILGFITDSLSDPFNGAKNIDSRMKDLDAEAAKYQKASDMLRDRFGGNEGQLRDLVVGDRGIFDALLKTFHDMGPEGDIVVDKLKEIRGELVGARDKAEELGPVLKALGPDTAKSFTEIGIALQALPKTVPIKITDDGGQYVFDMLKKLNQQVSVDDEKKIKVEAPLAPEVIKLFEDMGVKLDVLDDKTIVITAIDNASETIDGIKFRLSELVLPGSGAAGTPGFTPRTPGAPPQQQFNGAQVPPGLASLFPPPVPGVPPPRPDQAPPPIVAPGGDQTGNRPVPDSPVDERGNKITDADRRKANRESINPNDFMVDPWAGMNAPRVGNNGGLNVNIVGGLPGMPGGLTFPGGMTGGKSPWDLVLPHEGGTWDNNDTGGHGHFGGLQFDPNTWRAFGGEQFAKNPADATREQQIEIANRTAWTGWNGTAPQGLKAWEAITKGMVPGINENMTRAQFEAAVGNLAGPVATGAPGARNVTGLFGGQTTPGIDQLAQLVAQAFPGVNLGGWRPSDGPNTPTGHQRGVALDIGIQDQAVGDAINNWLRANAAALGIKSTIWRDTWKDFQGNQSTVKGHQDHVHAEVDGKELGAGVASSLKDNLYSINGPSMIDPTSGESGYFQVDQQAVMRAQQAVEAAGRDVSKAAYELAVATKDFNDGLIDQQELTDKQWALQEAQEKLTNEQMDYAEAQRGKFKESEKMDFSKLPFGDPRKILAGAITGAGGSPEDVAALVSPILGSIAAPLGQAAGDATTNALSALNLPTRQGPASDLSTLVRERNPLTPLAMAGYNVPDYSVAGGGPGAQNLLTNQGPPGDASGRMFSDTGALLDRSFTNLQAALEAKIDQLTNVVNQVKDQLTEQVLGPTVEKAVAGALDGAAQSLGKTIGETAGPIIANAVAQAIPKGSSNPGSSLVQTGVGAIDAGGGAIIGGGGQPGGFFDLSDSPGFGPLFGSKQIPGFAVGGPVRGPGTATSDSILARLSAGEWVVNARDVQRAGGFRGMQEWTKSLPGFATGGGVIGDETVGADFFGVSQIPILGAIVNLLVRVLLKVIGVTIEVRDTLDEMSTDFRQFRGDAFRAFEASGRLMNDTSALLDRTNTSEQAAADERIRILKLVIEGIIKFIIEKLVVPIGKAVANSLINAGAGAAGGAIGASFPGGSIVGGMVSSVISSAGSAGVDIAAEIFTEFSLALTSVLVDMIAEGLQGLFPDLISTIFGGNLLAFLADPITGLFTGLLGPILGLFTGLLGSLSLPSFDEGGLGSGVGFMPKATIRPERVLSPRQTANHERLTDLLDGGALDRIGRRTITVHAPITVLGDRQTGENVQNRLLALIDD